MFGSIDAIRPSQRHFSYVGTFSCLPRLNHYLVEDKVSCLKTKHNVSSEYRTSNPSIPSRTLIHGVPALLLGCRRMSQHIGLLYLYPLHSNKTSLCTCMLPPASSCSGHARIQKGGTGGPDPWKITNHTVYQCLFLSITGPDCPGKKCD